MSWAEARHNLFSAFPGAQVEDWVTPEGGEPRLVQTYYV